MLYVFGPLKLTAEARVTPEGVAIRVAPPGGGAGQWADVWLTRQDLVRWLGDIALARGGAWRSGGWPTRWPAAPTAGTACPTACAPTSTACAGRTDFPQPLPRRTTWPTNPAPNRSGAGGGG
jgi:hypothetical protein